MSTETTENKETVAAPVPAPMAPPQTQIINVAVQHPVAEPGSGMAIASMVVGIVGLLTSWFTIGFIAGVVALILGILSVKKPKGKGMAIAGIVTGGLAILTGVIVFMIGFMIGFANGISG